MLMHFCWKERASNNPEDDLVIFPDEIDFKKVTQNTTGKNIFNHNKRLIFSLGRVYILKWRSNARKLFFWLQEPKEDKDEEWCKKINDLVNKICQLENKFYSFYSLVESSTNTRLR